VEQKSLNTQLGHYIVEARAQNFSSKTVEKMQLGLEHPTFPDCNYMPCGRRISRDRSSLSASSLLGNAPPSRR